MQVDRGNPIRGYKVTDPQGKCIGHLFEVGKEYIHKGTIKICNEGYHFCLKASHCFSYYTFDSSNKVFEVEAYEGEYENHTEDSKICCSHLRIIRELKWDEVLIVVNEGSNNTGYSNSGDRNSGNWNSGDRNSGNWNSGNWNSGDRNSGDRNSGNWNSGDRNSGDRNSGNWNSGYSNSGDRNSGNWNSGDRNSGNWNSGDRNSGDRNSGDRNSGNWNSGDRNSGNWNSGNWNSGDRNSGYSNSGDRNSGAFCTIKLPFTLFNKPCKMTEEAFINSKVYRLMNSVDVCLWIQESVMTEKEKEDNPKYKTTGGYLKTIPYKEAFKNAWGNWTNENKKEFTNLENFEWKLFTEITGIEKEKL